MRIEDQLPEIFRKIAYHPSSFVYAWKSKDLEKLFEEFNLSNIAILSVEAWLVERGQTVSLIPLKHGDIRVYRAVVTQAAEEEWNDFVFRSTKEILNALREWDLEEKVDPEMVHRIWYHFELKTN